MILKSYNPENIELWDDFVINRSRNGSIFTERRFLSYHPEDRFVDKSILFFKNNEIEAVFPAAEIINGAQKNIVSHPGSSNGGLVYSQTSKTRDVLEILELLISHYKELKYSSLELRLNEPIFDNPASDELRYLLWHRGFTTVTKELSTCVKLDESSSWFTYGRKKNRTDINNLKRQGFSVVLTDSTEEIYPIIETNLVSKYNKKPTHTLSELIHLKRLYPNRIHYWKVTKEEKIAAVIVAFVVNKIGIHDFYIAQNSIFQNVNTMPLLFYSIFDYYRNKGFQWYNFGISSRADWIKWNILEFKERMGGRATIRESFCLNELQNYQPYINIYNNYNHNSTNL